MRPAFLITIDVEGDDLWACPLTITTENACFLPRFQALCEEFGLIPTYLTDHDMAASPKFVSFARGLVRRGAAEVGAHMHPWSTPPIRHLTANDYTCGPYAYEYRPELIREKLENLTRVLENTFETTMTSHRAGRWGFDGAYAQALIERRYVVDCSVTPRVSWRIHPGLPGGAGGPDFTDAPDEPYFVDLSDVCRPGTSALLEVPVTILPTPPRQVDRLRYALPRRHLLRRVLNRLFPPLTWLSPDGHNCRRMLRVLDMALADGRLYVEFMLHSSELMPGGSPRFRTAQSIEKLYRDLRVLFGRAASSFRAATLSGFAREVVG